MKNKSIFNKIILSVVTLNALIYSSICDTTVVLKEQWITCIEDNCPIDSIKNIFQNGVLRRQYRYFSCKDSGIFLYLNQNGDTLTKTSFIGKKTIGLSQQWYSANHPERFTAFDSTGRKNGWEVFWYENGNVKDSLFYVNDLVIKGTSFYHNGKPSLVEDSICGRVLFKATSYNVNGKKTGVIKNGTGTVFVCDSIGGDCKKLTFQNGKRLFDGKGGK
jgi:antitoxin component YwqK of YwqJK toxin-antitoxin module